MKGNSLMLNRQSHRRRREGLGLGGSKRNTRMGRSGPDLVLGGPLLILMGGSEERLELLLM